jgi:RNA polymerase sigma-70 factor (ECF subfamily)
MKEASSRSRPRQDGPVGAVADRPSRPGRPSRTTAQFLPAVRQAAGAESPSKLNPDSHRKGGFAQARPFDRRRHPRTDEQLIAAYSAGDRAGFAELVERYQRELFHFLVRFLGDRAAAEDIFQETFLQIHQSAKDFDPQRRLRPWLFTIAANKARDLMRANARRPASPLHAAITPGAHSGAELIDLLKSAAALPDEPLQLAELRQKVHSTVMNMPGNLREILLLSYFHQFPYKQIGDMLDIPLGTVKSRLHAAVAYFADRWQMANPNPFVS